METQDHYHTSCQIALAAGRITAVLYRHGAYVTGWPPRFPVAPRRPDQKRRGEIGSQSTRSLIRASFAASNAECDWHAMMTLTFREAHTNPKLCMRAMLEAMWPDGIGTQGVMWWQEFQRRGVVHYHIIMDERALRNALGGDWPVWRKVGKGKTARSVLAACQGDLLARVWTAITGDLSPEAYSFNCGGMVELLADKQSAAKYVSKYIGKQAQKVLPAGHAPSGRWWWISPVVEPVARGVFHVEHWPFKKAHRLVFDASRLASTVPSPGSAGRNSN